MSQITFENVCKSYGQKTVLQELSLSFAENRTTAVIGPSGSGKSTLLQLINGLVFPDAGRIFVFGEELDSAHLLALRRKIGYAVQGTGLFPHLTVERNIILLAELESWPAQRIRSRLQTLLHLVNLPQAFLKKYPYQLSGGEQQRVGLCRAMMLNPPIFLLDEPFGALDPITRSELHREFIKLQKSEQRTIILVTHDLREAIKLADEIVLLKEGVVQQSGRTDDILTHPATPFVEEFIHMQLEDEVHIQKTS